MPVYLAVPVGTPEVPLDPAKQQMNSLPGWPAPEGAGGRDSSEAPSLDHPGHWSLQVQTMIPCPSLLHFQKAQEAPPPDQNQDP